MQRVGPGFGPACPGFGQPQKRRPQRHPAAQIAARDDLLQHGHALEQAHVLISAADPYRRDLRGQQMLDFGAVELDAAGVGVEDARDQVDQGGFARAVGADEAVHAADANLGAQAAHGCHAAEVLDDVIEFQERVAGGKCGRSVRQRHLFLHRAGGSS